VYGPQVESFVSPNNINLCLLIRRSEVAELPSHLIDFLPTRPPKVDSLSYFGSSKWVFIPLLLLQAQTSVGATYRPPYMPFKVIYTRDVIIIDFIILVVALQHLVAAILWLFLNAVGYLIALFLVEVYWE